MTPEDKQYLLETLEYGLNKCIDANGDCETHFNSFANAIDIVKKLPIQRINTSFPTNIEDMKQAIIDDLQKLKKGYGKMKFAISKNTQIPVDVLTVLLRQLKIEGKIELIMTWCEETGRPDGSGYCLTENTDVDSIFAYNVN